MATPFGLLRGRALMRSAAGDCGARVVQVGLCRGVSEGAAQVRQQGGSDGGGGAGPCAAAPDHPPNPSHVSCSCVTTLPSCATRGPEASPGVCCRTQGMP